MLVQVQPDHRVQGEGWTSGLKCGAHHIHQVGPMPLAHGRVAQIHYQRHCFLERVHGVLFTLPSVGLSARLQWTVLTLAFPECGS